jgi:predicted phosphodiesterase
VRRAAVAVALFAVSLAAAANRPFTFAVLGDRTGSARPAVFKQILAEITLLNPDFIVCVGDLIQGYTDRATTDAQWDTVLGQLRSTGIPYYVAPGNHDISSDSVESVFKKRVGPPVRSFRRGNATFILLDNSRWRTADDLPPASLRWLDRELARAKKSRHVFVLMHRPYWRHALDQGRPERLHSKFKSAGVDYVFTGHDHFYCSHTWDGIRYFQVGPSGSRYKVYHEPGAGAFQNYLLCQVSGDTVALTVRAPGRNDPLPIDTVTYESIRLLELARESAVALGTVTVPSAGPAAAPIALTVRNVTGSALTAELSWRDSLTAWHVRPQEVTFSITPDGHVTHSFELNLSDPDSLYPLPGLTVPYEYAPGKKTNIVRSLPIRRQAELVRAKKKPAVDGKLTDSCWLGTPTLRAFGSRTGGISPVEPTSVWVALDDSLLYIGARCDESRMAGLRADAVTRDGKVREDDNLRVVLDFDHHSSTAGNREAAVPGFARPYLSALAGEGFGGSNIYYQVSVNPSGSIADRRCWVKDGKRRSSSKWNGTWQVATGKGAGSWTVEMSCPLADFGVVGQSWGVNASRFQARIEKVAVWQVPFGHQPDDFGLLRATD